MTVYWQKMPPACSSTASDRRPSLLSAMT